MAPQARDQRGFSIIELILVIVLLGALLGLGAGLVAQPFLLQQDVERRSRLADFSDSALQQISREVRAALPNSIVATPDSLTFERSIDGGRYRAAPTGDVLEIGQPDNSFEVLGPLARVPQAGQQLVVYNVAPGSSANRSLVTGFNVGTNVLSFQQQVFAFGSPMQRFFIVDGSIRYACSGGVITRTFTPVGGSAETSRLVSQVNCSQTSFRYDAGDSSRNALLTVRLALAEAGEEINLVHQTHVLNAP